MPNRTLALEIGSTTIRGVLVESSLRAQRVLGTYTVPHHGPDTLAADIRALTSTHGLQWDEVMAALPGTCATHRFLTLPFRDRKRLDQIVPFELESHLPFDLDESVVDYQVLGEHDGQTLVLAALAPKETVRAYLAALVAAGVEPRVLDLAPLAPLNLLRQHRTPVGEAVLVIAERDQTTLALLHGGRLTGLRTLDRGATTAADVGDLAREIHWTVTALSPNGALQEATVWIGGASAAVDGLGAALGRVLGIATRSLDELAVDAVPATMRRDQAPFATALGLALRERGATGGFGIDFRRGEFTYHHERDALWQMLAGTGVLALVAVLLMVAAFVVEGRRLGGQRDTVRAEMRALFTAAMPGTTTIVNEKAQLEAEVAALEKRRQRYGRLAPSASRAIDLLRGLTVGVPDDVGLDIQELALDDETMRVRGSTRTYEGVEAIKRSLEGRPEFRAVQAKDVRASVDGQRVAFGLDLTPAEGSTP
jgi:general secretion pathway protein L